MASRITAAWVKRKWTCSEESSPEAGVHGRIKYIIAKHKMGMTSVRKSRRFEAEPLSARLYTTVYTAAEIPAQPLRMPETVPLLRGKFLMLVTTTAVPNHALLFVAITSASHNCNSNKKESIL
jgi:hypothetical protein